MKYLISYDLVDADPYDYQELYDDLKSFNAERVLESQWVVEIPDGKFAKSLRLRLDRFLEKNDRILVSTLVNYSSRNLIAKISEVKF